MKIRIAAIALFLLAAAPWQGIPSAQTNLRAMVESLGLKLVEKDGRAIVEVTMRDTLRLALERNIALESVRLGENLAQSSLEAARNKFSATLTNSVDYGRSLSPTPYSNSGGDFLALNGSDSFTLSASYSKPTASGIEYGLTFSETRSNVLRTSIPTAGLESTAETTSESLGISALTGSVNIPISQDAGSEFNTISERRSLAGLTGSRLTIKERELTLVELAASTYWNLVGALEDLNVQAEAVKLSEQLLRDNRLRLEAGVLSPFDVQVTEAQLARERERLLTARANVLRVEDLARAILNVPVIDFAIRPLDVPSVRKLELDYGKLLEQVYGSNTAVKQLENGLITNNLDLDEARNGERTNLDLELYYTLQSYDRDSLAGLSGDGYGATLTWTLPLFDISTRETIRQRMLQRRQIELNLANLKSELNVRLQGVMRQIRLAEEEVETARVAMRLADEQLKNEIERFKVGESTSFQVAQAQQDASSARVREILARLRFERNFLSLLVMTGDIFNHYGLTPSYQ